MFLHKQDLIMFEAKQEDDLRKMTSSSCWVRHWWWLTLSMFVILVIIMANEVIFTPLKGEFVTLYSGKSVYIPATEDGEFVTLYNGKSVYIPASEERTNYLNQFYDPERKGPYFVCYYTVSDTLKPRDIHPILCTHINVGFAQVENKQVKLDDGLHRALSEVVKLRLINPGLKLLLSVGGAGDQDGFSKMVVDHASRKTFIRSLKNILRTYALDGIDLDWEFPAVHSSYFIKKRERQHFSQLLREIRAEYIREKRDYLLTIAVAAPKTIVDAAYDVDQINDYVDFVNIMTYDFHYFTKFTPFTGLNSPLYARPSEELYFATLNINYTVNMYISKGLSRKKIVVGIPTYGHTFTLINPDNTGIGSPASGFGSLGSLGFVNYPDICVFIKNATNKVVVKEENAARVPYLYGGSEWISYDTPQSVTEKAKYIMDNMLGGAMIFSLNADDYQGLCNDVGNNMKFPLAHAAKKVVTAAYDPQKVY